MTRRWLKLLLTSACLVGLARPAAAGTLLGIDYDTGYLFNISPNNAVVTYLGPTGIVHASDLQFAPDGTLYSYTTGSKGSLFTIDPLSLAIKRIGSLGVTDFEGGLAIGKDGTAYGTDAGSLNNSELIKIDLHTGQATVIGTIDKGKRNHAHHFAGLAIRPDGQLIGLDAKTNALLLIDPSSLTTSVLQPIKPSIGPVGGMTVIGNTGYFDTGDKSGNGNGSNSLYSFDLNTGQYQLVGGFVSPDIGPNDTGLSGLAGTPFIIPEPSSVLLAGMGVLGLVGYAWRRRLTARPITHSARCAR
jgi:hypothetical protein